MQNFVRTIRQELQSGVYPSVDDNELLRSKAAGNDFIMRAMNSFVSLPFSFSLSFNLYLISTFVIYNNSIMHPYVSLNVKGREIKLK